MQTSELRKLGLELIDTLVDRLAVENSLSAKARDMLIQDARKAILDGRLPSRDALTTARITKAADATPCVTVVDFNAWLDATGSMLVRLSTLTSVPRDPAAIRSQWEGRTAKDFIEDINRYGSFTAAAKAYGVSRQAYTFAYYRAVGKSPLPATRGAPQGVALWPQGVAAVRKKRTNSKR